MITNPKAKSSLFHFPRVLVATGLLLLAAAPVEAARVTIAIKPTSALMIQQWSIISSTYLSQIQNYQYLWSGYPGVTYQTSADADSIDFIFTVPYFDYAGFAAAWNQNLALINAAAAAAGIRWEITIDQNSVATERVEIVGGAFPGLANLGQDWFWTQGMGYFFAQHYPWIWENQHLGWLYTVATSSGYFFYDLTRGWIWVPTGANLTDFIDL